MYLILNKNKVNGICTTSLESVEMSPGTPESGVPEEGGNRNDLLFIIYISFFYFKIR